MNRTLAIAMAGATSLAFVATTQAQLLALDSYPIGPDRSAGEYGIVPLNSAALDNLVTLGFNTGRYNQGGGTAQFAATDVGLSTTLASDEGTGKVNYNAAPADNIYRSVARGLTTGALPSTFWVSHAANRGNIPGDGGTGFALTGFGNFVQPSAGTTTGNLEGLFVGFAQDGVAGNFGNLVIRHRDSAASSTSDVVLLDGSSASTFGTTYTVLMKVEANAGGGSTDNISWWLDPTDFADEAALTASSAASGTFSSFAIPADNILDRLNYGAQNWNGNVFFDEPRIAGDLGSIVPEPASMGVVGLAAMGLLGRRRK